MTPQTNLIQEIVVPTELSPVDALIYLTRISDKAENLTREGLHKVFTENLWEGRFSSWKEFVQSSEGLNKSESWASKHIAIYKHYTLEGGISQENLEGAPTESLYLAKFLPGTTEEQVAISRTLSRREIKETKNELDQHQHEPFTIQICKTCNMRLHEKDFPQTHSA